MVLTPNDVVRIGSERQQKPISLTTHDLFSDIPDGHVVVDVRAGATALKDVSSTLVVTLREFKDAPRQLVRSRELRVRSRRKQGNAIQVQVSISPKSAAHVWAVLNRHVVSKYDTQIAFTEGCTYRQKPDLWDRLYTTTVQTYNTWSGTPPNGLHLPMSRPPGSRL